MSIITQTIYNKRYLGGLLPGLMLCSLAGFGQNIPDVVQSVVPGSIATGGGAPVPDYEPTINASGMRKVNTIVPRSRDTASANFHAATSPLLATRSVQYLGGNGSAMQTVIPAFSKNTGTYITLYNVRDPRTTTDNYGFKPYVVVADIDDYEPNAPYYSEAYHNTSSRYPEEGGAANNMKGLSVTKVSNTSTASERSSTTYLPGLARIGQNRGVKTTLVFNKDAQSSPNTPEQAAYNIRAWDINSNGLPVSTATYAAGSLSGTLTNSPDGSYKWVFSDKDGKPVYEASLLLQQSIANPPFVTTTYKYAYTYYVYDEKGQLRFVLPPKAVSYARSNSWSISSAVLAELCFAYEYDAKGRQYAVHKPGETSGSTAAYTELVYDKTGRTIMRRSPLEAAQGLWEAILYDDKHRVLTTGLLTNSGSRESWQQNVNNSAATTASDIGYYFWGAGKNTRPAVSITNFNPQSINYYDSYNLTAAQTPLYNDGFSSAAASLLVSSTPGAEPYEQGVSTFGRLTATAVKTVKPAGLTGDGLADWSYSKPFYDKEGRNIYTIHQNATGGKDTLASVYDYMGKVLYSLKYATINLGTPRNIKEQYKYVYEDYSGRLLQLQHRTNIQQSWKDLESNSYDELGQLTMKVYGNNAESQVFTYNIRGELKGINEYYALTGDKQERNMRFGEALRYDYGFSVPKYDGNVSGVVWRGATRTVSGAYGYRYDNSGRMLSGTYYQGNNTSNTVPTTWSNASVDYSEYIGYDEQGNITNLQRWGRRNSQVAGLPPEKLDQLAYTYFANSNKLQKVVDTNTFLYGRGDFVNGSAQGYSYDNSGNLGSDLSKGISSVVYTWFNKPATVTYSNGNVIRYAYDAGGSKLGEFITEAGVTKKLHYIGNIVLENQEVQYMSTPAGRTNLRNNESKEEFLIKDRLGNVRAVIADVPATTGIGTMAMQKSYTAGYETAEAGTEEQLFDKVSELREEKPGSTNMEDVKAALLEGSQQATGTSILLKVMAGDKIAVNAENFYEQLQANPEAIVSGEAVMAQVLNSMAGGATLSTSEGTTNVLSNGTDPAALQSAYEALQAAETDSTRPRSYLNYLFFDEQMQLVAEHSRLWQADGEADWKTIGTEEELEVPENGYIAVYLSNQGAEPVYFDNLAVNVTPGVLLEEKHYYPYGLPIQGWGNVATGSLPNRQRYQGNEYREEAGLNWMDFHNRQYDPQLGRFLGVDALADAGGQQVLSPYHAMACNPALMVDPFGLQSGKSDPRPPGSLLTGGNVPGSSGWGAISGYYKSMLGPANQRPPELQGMLGAMAMMSILSGDAAGAASRMSPGGGSAMSSYEQMVQIDGWQRQWQQVEKSRSGNQKALGGHGTLWELITDGFLTSGWYIDGYYEEGNSINVTFTNGDGTGGSASLWGAVVELKEQTKSDEVNYPWIKKMNDFYGQGTFITANVLSFVGTKPGKVLSMGGAYIWRASTYSAQKALLTELAYGSKAIKGIGNGLGVGGILITVGDMYYNGVTTSNSIDLFMGGVSFIPGWGWIAGGVYFIGNAALKAGTGKDLGEHIDNW